MTDTTNKPPAELEGEERFAWYVDHDEADPSAFNCSIFEGIELKDRAYITSVPYPDSDDQSLSQILQPGVYSLDLKRVGKRGTIARRTFRRAGTRVTPASNEPTPAPAPDLAEIVRKELAAMMPGMSGGAPSQLPSPAPAIAAGGQPMSMMDMLALMDRMRPPQQEAMTMRDVIELLLPIVTNRDPIRDTIAAMRDLRRLAPSESESESHDMAELAKVITPLFQSLGSPRVQPPRTGAENQTPQKPAARPDARQDDAPPVQAATESDAATDDSEANQMKLWFVTQPVGVALAFGLTHRIDADVVCTMLDALDETAAETPEATVARWKDRYPQIDNPAAEAQLLEYATVLAEEPQNPTPQGGNTDDPEN